MRHVVIPGPGGYDRLTIQQAPDPVPGPGEVRVEVRAIGVNYADCVVRMGLYASAKKYVGWPITPGFEVAGHVAALGPGVTDPPVGTPVLAVTRFGGYASQVVVPRRQVLPVPTGWTLAQAAGFPSVFFTAWFGLCHLAHARPGESVLVHAAAGGVGGALLQIARSLGCRVCGVVGAPHKVELARELGADEVIDRSREDLWARARAFAPGGYDVVLDANGVATLRQSWRHLAPCGRLVVYGFHSMLPRAKAQDYGGNGGRPNWRKLAWDFLRTPRFSPLEMTTTNRSVLAFNLSFLFERADLLEEGVRFLWPRADDRTLRSPPVTEYPLDRVADAHRALESGQTVGKLVLIP